jgi:hypothetical protein
MRCKPGDLAIFVRSECGNEGRIVRCVHLLPPQRAAEEGWVTDCVWVTDSPVMDTDGELTCRAMDEYLRPIRPGSISDEEVRDLYAPKVPEAA